MTSREEKEANEVTEHLKERIDEVGLTKDDEGKLEPVHFVKATEEREV